MDSFQNFVNEHPLTTEQVEVMYNFLDHAQQVDLLDDRYLTIGDILDILVGNLLETKNMVSGVL